MNEKYLSKNNTCRFFRPSFKCAGIHVYQDFESLAISEYSKLFFVYAYPRKYHFA